MQQKINAAEGPVEAWRRHVRKRKYRDVELRIKTRTLEDDNDGSWCTTHLEDDAADGRLRIVLTVCDGDQLFNGICAGKLEGSDSYRNFMQMLRSEAARALDRMHDLRESHTVPEKLKRKDVSFERVFHGSIVEDVVHVDGLVREMVYLVRVPLEPKQHGTKKARTEADANFALCSPNKQSF